jgi:hypothetical protein
VISGRVVGELAEDGVDDRCGVVRSGRPVGDEHGERDVAAVADHPGVRAGATVLLGVLGGAGLGVHRKSRQVHCSARPLGDDEPHHPLQVADRCRVELVEPRAGLLAGQKGRGPGHA